MRLKFLLAVLVIAACVVAGAGSLGAQPAPFQSFTSNASPPIELGTQAGQNSCSFSETGTVGPTDAYVSLDGVNWSLANVTTQGGSVQSMPFTPTAGATYVIAPLSRYVEVAPDSTWASQSATAGLWCSASTGNAAGGSGGAAASPNPCATGATSGCFTEDLLQGGNGQLYADSLPDPNSQPAPTPSPIATSASGATTYTFTMFTGQSSGTLSYFLHNFHIVISAATTGTVLADLFVSTSSCTGAVIDDLSGLLTIPVTAGQSLTLYGSGANGGTAVGAAIGGKPYAFPPNATPYDLCLSFHMGATSSISLSALPVWSESKP